VVTQESSLSLSLSPVACVFHHHFEKHGIRVRQRRWERHRLQEKRKDQKEVIIIVLVMVNDKRVSLFFLFDIYTSTKF
jgi:hypothetical protein